MFQYRNLSVGSGPVLEGNHFIFFLYKISIIHELCLVTFDSEKVRDIAVAVVING